ncbi:flagellar brake protein [Evansella clarkii]|uniref:flagellar brake protein n=1 Tax=Evansella clarkii TaxID=79879 RepID=UPI000997FA21|nr:PilZ domain-containing protein [Evansella clarkii]
MIKAGCTIFLETTQPDGSKKRYRSKLLDYASDLLYIDFPVEEGFSKQVNFHRGTEFRVWFLGNDDAIYLFRSQVAGAAELPRPMLVLSDPGKKQYKRIQRRQYVRINAAADVAIHPLDHEFEPFTSVTADLSGGGMSVILPDSHQLKKGKAIRVWIALHFNSGESLYVETKSRVVRIHEYRDRQRASLQFMLIKETERQKVIRYCFEKQLAIRNREKERQEGNIVKR